MHKLSKLRILLGSIFLLSVVSCSSQKQAENASNAKKFENEPWKKEAIDLSSTIDLSQKSEVVRDNFTLKDNNMVGVEVGAVFPDVTLFRADGTSFKLYEELTSNNKPILFISGSYSCPIFRKNIPLIDSLSIIYNYELLTYVVYTVEAHPDDTESPYRDEVWQMGKNVSEGVIVNQSRTFEERVATAKMMVEATELNTSMLYDGPDNRFWFQLGQAPVFCYIIKPDHTVAFKSKNFSYGDVNNCINGSLKAN